MAHLLTAARPTYPGPGVGSVAPGSPFVAVHRPDDIGRVSGFAGDGMDQAEADALDEIYMMANGDTNGAARR